MTIGIALLAFRLNNLPRASAIEGVWVRQPGTELTGTWEKLVLRDDRSFVYEEYFRTGKSTTIGTYSSPSGDALQFYIYRRSTSPYLNEFETVNIDLSYRIVRNSDKLLEVEILRDNIKNRRLTDFERFGFAPGQFQQGVR